MHNIFSPNMGFRALIHKEGGKDCCHEHCCFCCYGVAIYISCEITAKTKNSFILEGADHQFCKCNVKMACKLYTSSIS